MGKITGNELGNQVKSYIENVQERYETKNNMNEQRTNDENSNVLE